MTIPYARFVAPIGLLSIEGVRFVAAPMCLLATFRLLHIEIFKFVSAPMCLLAIFRFPHIEIIRFVSVSMRFRVIIGLFTHREKLMVGFPMRSPKNSDISKCWQIKSFSSFNKKSGLTTAPPSFPSFYFSNSRVLFCFLLYFSYISSNDLLFIL